jgi:hypothetical protein
MNLGVSLPSVQVTIQPQLTTPPSRAVGMETDSPIPAAGEGSTALPEANWIDTPKSFR